MRSTEHERTAKNRLSSAAFPEQHSYSYQAVGQHDPSHAQQPGAMPPAPAQQQPYGASSWPAGSDHMSGHMTGAMTGAMGTPSHLQPPTGEDGRFMSRTLSASWLGEGEGDEPPILEELGINFGHIRSKTRIVLYPRRHRFDQSVVDDDDFAGPLLFCLVLGVLLLFKGKVHFGTIYGVFVIGLLGIWAVLNLMSQKGIDIYRTASVMGYSLLPIVLLAALSIPLDLRGFIGLLFIPATVLWCSTAASIFFVAALEAHDRRWLLAYPVALFYTCFALITVF